jgi:hypothetical protein
MIAMNDLHRHFNSTDTMYRAVAPVFHVFAHFRRVLPRLYTAKTIADIEAESGVPLARREAFLARRAGLAPRGSINARLDITDFRKLDDVNPRVDCLARQGGVYDV